MLDAIVNAMTKHELENIFFAVEFSSNYHFHILNFIASAECLRIYNLTLFQLNANLVNKFKKIQPKTSKIGKYDAYVIANRLRFRNLTEPFVAFNEYESLKRLTRTRFHIIKNLESEYNYFLSQLYLKFSEYKKLLFSNTFSTTSISLQTIKGLKDTLKSINKAIECELEQFDQTLTSIPGIGVIYATCIIAEIGNPNRFTNDGKVAKFTGLTWN